MQLTAEQQDYVDEQRARIALRESFGWDVSYDKDVLKCWLEALEEAQNVP